MARCGTVSVLEDRTKPRGRRLGLRVMVLPARGGPVEPEPLVFLNGGPGASTVAAAPYASWALETLRDTHDLLLADMRGTGGSGALDCHLYDDGGRMTAFLAPMFPIVRVRECAERLARHADLTQFTTDAAVADLEEVRAALGPAQLNLFGASYGARLALEYMRQHPEHVRRAVLLSPIPPDQPIGGAASRGAESALAYAFASCAEDDECRRRAPTARADVETVLARLQRSPVTVRLWSWRRLAYESLALSRRGIAELLWVESYDPNAILRALPMVHEAANGDYAPLVRRLARASRLRRSGRSEGLMLSVLCAEDAPRLQARAVVADDGHLLGEPIVPELVAACRQWPTGSSVGDTLPVTSEVPTLVIAGGKDPITPPDFAASVAAHLSRSERYLDPSKGHASLDDKARTRMATFLQCDVRCR